jgi:phosphate transport system substrate-binding protein
VSTEDYPLTRRLYLYSAASPPPLIRRFIDFVGSKAGQDVVAAAGFVSQNVTAVVTAADKSGPPEYRRLSANAERLSLNLRFRSGKTQFDNKALVDLDRAVTFISDLHYTGEQVMIFGFADGRGTPDVNLRLSKERASAVSAAFEQRGLKPAVVTGFGAELPVASNDNEEGRDRNRRVEIWIHKK